MKINWFPGHMKKTLDEIKLRLKNVDIVVYLLDARAPLSSLNPSLTKLAMNKPILFVINKIDLADEERVKNLVKGLKNQTNDYIFLNSTSSGSASVIKSKINALAKAKIDKMKAKGLRAVIRVMVIGVPNCGKSTLVNNLCGKAKAITGNKAGVTKSMQWVSIGGNIELCDTPGTLYPNLSDQNVAKKLYYLGSVKDEVVGDEVEFASDLLGLLEEKYPQLVANRYGESLSVESVAQKRGYLLGGGELDLSRAANAIIDDFRKGRIGKITLD